jgi:hypothetical protein
VLTAAWIYFLPVILTSTLQKRTGFNVRVTELHFNPFNAKVDLTGFVITNPESFPRPEFIEISSFSANAKLKTLFSDRPEFDYAWIEIACVAFVRNADGVLNAKLFSDRLNPAPPMTSDEKADFLKKLKPAPIALDAKATTGGPVNLAKVENKSAAKDAKTASGKETAEGKDAVAKERTEEPPMKFFIKRLEVRLEKVIVADYTTPTPTVKEFDRKFYYTYNDVSDPKQLLAPFVLKPLESVGEAIKGLIPGEIGKAVGAVTKPGEEVPVAKKKTDAPAEDPLKTVVEKLEETPKP